MSLLACRDVLLLLTEKLEGKLHAEVEAQVEAHLKRCCSCGLVYASAKKTLGEIDQGWMAPLNGDGLVANCRENRHVED